VGLFTVVTLCRCIIRQWVALSMGLLFSDG
jgi:hypothetical protein